MAYLTKSYVLMNSFTFFFFFWPYCLTSNQRSLCTLLQWKCSVLNTGSPTSVLQYCCVHFSVSSPNMYVWYVCTHTYIPWRREWQPTPVFLPGESHGQRRVCWATVHGVTKSRTWLSDFHSLTHSLTHTYITVEFIIMYIKHLCIFFPFV